MGARWYLKTDRGAFPGPREAQNSQKNRGEGGIEPLKECRGMELARIGGERRPDLEQRLHKNGTRYWG
jgi:hypothetical protein